MAALGCFASPRSAASDLYLWSTYAHASQHHTHEACEWVKERQMGSKQSIASQPSFDVWISCQPRLSLSHSPHRNIAKTECRRQMNESNTENRWIVVDALLVVVAAAANSFGIRDNFHFGPTHTNTVRVYVSNLFVFFFIFIYFLYDIYNPLDPHINWFFTIRVESPQTQARSLSYLYFISKSRGPLGNSRYSICLAEARCSLPTSFCMSCTSAEVSYTAINYSRKSEGVERNSPARAKRR